MSSARLKLAKNQANVKQHSEAEFLLFENYLLFSCMLSSKNNRRYSKKCTKNKCLSKFGYMINANENEAEIEK